MERLRGARYPVEILAHFRRAQPLRPLLELIGGRDNRADGPGGLGAQAAQIDLALLARARERLIDEQHQLSRVLVQLAQPGLEPHDAPLGDALEDRKSTRLNSSHLVISYAV